MSLTIEEQTPPSDTEEVVPGGTEYLEQWERENPLIGEVVSEAESVHSQQYEDPPLFGYESGEEEVQPYIEEVKYEEKLSADPSLTEKAIDKSFYDSFDWYETTSGAYRLEPTTRNVQELPFAKLLITALGKAESKEEHERIKNSFFTGVHEFLPEGREYAVARNKVNAALEVYFDNLNPYVDYEREDEFEKEHEWEESEESEEYESAGEEGFFGEEKKEFTTEESKKPTDPRKARSQQQFVGYEPTKEEKSSRLEEKKEEFKEETSFKDVGDLFEKLFSADLIRLLQAAEGDSKGDQAEYEENARNIIDTFVDEFQKEFADEPPSPEQFQNILEHIQTTIPNPSLRDILVGELERLRRSRTYEEKELEDLPPHSVKPHSLGYAKRLGEYALPGRYGTRGIRPVRGISKQEKDAAQEAGYDPDPTGYLTKTGRKTIWKGPKDGLWVYEPGTGEFKNVKSSRKVLGSEEGEIVEFVRPGPEVVPVDELERESERILQQQRRISEREPNYRTNRSKKLGEIKIQWTAGKPQRDILIPAHTRFEDVVKLAEILRLESGTLIDNVTKESLQIGKEVPVSVIISYIQTMLARNVGHELYFIWAPSKKASGLFLGGGLMKYFQKPLMRHKQYHTTPMHRFKEYVAKAPLSAMSRHHRGSGLFSGGAPPGSGWNEPAPTTFMPFAFENAGAYPLPKRSYYDTDAIDKDPRAMGRPFGTLPPGLGGPYTDSQEGVGGQIANREPSWRDPTGGAKVSDIATGVAGVSAALASTGIGAVVAAPLAAVSGIVAGLGKIFGF